MTDIILEDIQKATDVDPVKTTDSTLHIDQAGEKLPLGEHKFELTVVDSSGNRSAPATVLVFVIDTENPTAILELQDANGRPVSENRISFGSSFILYGKRSTDAGGGTIKEYIWKMVS